MSDKLKKIRDDLSKTQYSWLVTGCAGFIGSHLTEFLLSAGQKVVGLDNFSTGFEENLTQIKNSLPKEQVNNFVFIKGDIRDSETCLKACNGIDFVLHQAALGSVPRSIKDPLQSNDVNVSGALNIFHAAKENNVKRVLYASSSSVYGDNLNDSKIEEITGNLLSPYAVTKKVNELYAQVFSATYNIEIVGIRYFNVFGPRQNPNGAYAAVIPKWINTLLQNKPVTIFGDGKTSRDFTYVENVVALNTIVATSKSKVQPGTVINGALGNTTSLIQLYDLLKQKIETKKTLNFTIPSSPLFADFRAGDIRHSNANMSKALELFNYTPLISIEEGMDKTVDWYIQDNLRLT